MGNFVFILGKLGSDSKEEKRKWVSNYDGEFLPPGSLDEPSGAGLAGRSNRVIGRTSLSAAWSLTLLSICLFPVTICSVPCTDPKVHDEKKGIPIYMGIKGKDLCLFCAEAGGKPTLQLKVSGCTENERSTVTFCFI